MNVVMKIDKEYIFANLSGVLGTNPDRRIGSRHENAI
ncbi:hypothetical protein PPOLYM_03288 [Paenibacillus polymyxa]|jgi:hypothetical protein|nr:hypothetical protein SAMN04488603_105258 [Paenibacillus sp. cl130]VUG06880.1 hypothetical protein PPOLYM_03288 [Paenibacillus polymyxa]